MKIIQRFLLNIYIYGSKLFQTEISMVLSRDSIIEKLDEINETNELFGHIITVNTREDLQSIIELNSDNIFLIDHQRIISDNFFIKKIKFLNADPEYGIEESFLEKYEIAIKVELNDVASMAQYILNRLETYNISEITQIEEIREADIISALLTIN